MRKAKVFTGSSHTELAAQIVENLAIPAAPVIVKQFENKELALELGVSVRNEDVFIIQSGSDEVNDHLMELLILINSCRVASAKRITAVIPYFPYSKQSKKKRARGAISAKLVANMLSVAGVDHIITMDLHSDQMQGFFNRPVDNLLSEPTISKFIMEEIPEYQNGVVVSKNPGGVKRVTSLADRLKIDFAMIHKERNRKKKAKKIVLDPAYATSRDSLNVLASSEDESLPSSATTGVTSTATPTPGPENVDQSPNLISQEESTSANNKQYDGLQLVGDVNGKIAFILDDMIDSPDSFVAAARLLARKGASRVYIIATHGILSCNALQEIEECDAVYQVRTVCSIL
ncbi:phosphoribosyltransferase-like protein [Paraphysoderma sedebokerense]|nr:phosphoribosyltransferase-like protein [Paraphysoderma sedebokerense]